MSNTFVDSICQGRKNQKKNIEIRMCTYPHEPFWVSDGNPLLGESQIRKLSYTEINEYMTKTIVEESFGIGTIRIKRDGNIWIHMPSIQDSIYDLHIKEDCTLNHGIIVEEFNELYELYMNVGNMLIFIVDSIMCTPLDEGAGPIYYPRFLDARVQAEDCFYVVKYDKQKSHLTSIGVPRSHHTYNLQQGQYKYNDAIVRHKHIKKEHFIEAIHMLKDIYAQNTEKIIYGIFSYVNYVHRKKYNLCLTIAWLIIEGFRRNVFDDAISQKGLQQGNCINHLVFDEREYKQTGKILLQKDSGGFKVKQKKLKDVSKIKHIIEHLLYEGYIPNKQRFYNLNIIRIHRNEHYHNPLNYNIAKDIIPLMNKELQYIFEHITGRMLCLNAWHTKSRF